MTETGRGWHAFLMCCLVAFCVGCSGDAKSTGSAGSPAPSLDSPNADERAAAAREAAKKFGAEP